MGVRQDISARRVEAAVVLHVQELGWAAQRKLDPQEEWQLIHQHLEDTGINVDGVTNQIRRRLEHVRQVLALFMYYQGILNHMRYFP